jgi:Cu-processing system permease protein
MAEKVSLGLARLNPVDLGRILMLMQLDISALMGCTSAFFQQFFHSSMGTLVSGGAFFILVLWPNLMAMRVFKKRDF